MIYFRHLDPVELTRVFDSKLPFQNTHFQIFWFDDEMLKVHLRLRTKYKFLIEVDEEMYKYLQLYFKIC
jgi:uncharacterized protein YcfL